MKLNSDSSALSDQTEYPKRSKILLVVSDFHLGEGRRNWDGTLNVIEDFNADSRFAEFLEFHSQAYDEVELVLNGNFLEMLSCRVIHDFPDVAFETYALEIFRNQMEGHPIVFDALAKFMQRASNRLIYILGEADLGMLWPDVQEAFKKRVSERVEFQGTEYSKDGILVQHGHQYDALFNMDYENPFREVDSLPVLKLSWGAFFYANFVQPLRAVRPQFYRVKPMKTYLLWAFLFETKFFFKIIFQFIRMLFRARSQKLFPGANFFDVFRLFRRSVDSESMETYAELLLTSDDIQKVIFGYTHIPNYRQFRNSKEYFNTGTWTRNLSLEMRSLGAFQKLTYVQVEFREGARAKLMEWKGRYQVIEDFA